MTIQNKVETLASVTLHTHTPKGLIQIFRPVDLKMLELAMGLGRRQLTVLCHR